MVCVDVHDIPVVAFVDPDMMSSMPKGLTAATGMDALTHLSSILLKVLGKCQICSISKLLKLFLNH